MKRLLAMSVAVWVTLAACGEGADPGSNADVAAEADTSDPSPSDSGDSDDPSATEDPDGETGSDGDAGQDGGDDGSGGSDNGTNAVPPGAATDAWHIDRKVRRELPTALRSQPQVTVIGQATDPDEPSRVQWFDDTMVHLRPDGVAAYGIDGVELWSWDAPDGIDDLDRDQAVRFENQVVLLGNSLFGEQLVGLDLMTGKATTYGETTLGSLFGPTSTGVWGTNASGDFEGADLSEVGIEFNEVAWKVDTNGPIGFSERATAVAYYFDDSLENIDELRWFDLDSGSLAHAPAPTTDQADVDLGDDEVYAVSEGDDGPPELVAYDLESGEVRWSTDIDGDADFGIITPVNENLVALSLDMTVVFDATTGAEVWREADDLAADHNDSLFYENGPGVIVTVSSDNRLYARNVATGELLWATDERDRIDGAVVAAATAVYVLDPDSAEVVAYDLFTGEDLWSVTIEADALISVDVTDGAIAVTTPTELLLLRG